MTGTGFNAPGSPAPGAPVSGGSTGGSSWWARRPRRSENDRMVAGVAGGLGRMLRVDPVLIRVAFVVLAFFGGSGILLYALGWLLLPSDSDEVSPGEALLGRGRSRTSPVLAVVLSVVVVVGLLSTFSPSWGLPFFPALIIAMVIGILLMRHRGRTMSPAEKQEFADRVNRSVQEFSDKAARFGSSWGAPASGGQTSPFDSPAFWERDGRGGWRQTDMPSGYGAAAGNPMTPGAPGAVPDGMPAPSPADRVDGPPPTASEPFDPAAPRTSPPSWDPLGVAPFAWDLPDPTPVGPEPVVGPTTAVRGRGAIGRVTIGLALLAGAVSALGVLSGWFTMSWAAVTAIPLAVIGAGLLIASVRGRTAGLVGPGIFLALVTAALSVTGLTGTQGYGEQTWQPASVADVQPSYLLNGGQGTLDLSAVQPKAGERVAVDVDVNAGHAQVILPAASSGTNYEVTCSANAGRVDCLGANGEGWRTEKTVADTDNSDAGTIVLDVHVGAGYAEVTQHG